MHVGKTHIVGITDWSRVRDEMRPLFFSLIFPIVESGRTTLFLKQTPPPPPIPTSKQARCVRVYTDTALGIHVPETAPGWRLIPGNTAAFGPRRSYFDLYFPVLDNLRPFPRSCSCSGLWWSEPPAAGRVAGPMGWYMQRRCAGTTGRVAGRKREHVGRPTQTTFGECFLSPRVQRARILAVKCRQTTADLDVPPGAGLAGGRISSGRVQRPRPRQVWAAHDKGRPCGRTSACKTRARGVSQV